jgi:hypothetical protein
VLYYGFSDVGQMVGQEQIIREFGQLLAALPRTRFAPVLHTGFDTELAMRAAAHDGAYWFYVANPGYWPVQGTVELSGTGLVYDVVSGKPVATTSRDGKTAVPVALPPFGLRAFRTGSDRMQAAAWSVKPVDGAELQYMQGLMAEADHLIGLDKARTPLSSDDVVFVFRTITNAGKAMGDKHYARAWSLLTDWRFWTLVKDIMPMAEKYTQALPGNAGEQAERRFPELAAVRAPKAPVIDGDLSDPVWRSAPRTTPFAMVDKQLLRLGKQLAECVVQVAYDDEAVYVGFSAAEADPASLRAAATAEANLMRAHDDILDLWLMPDPQGTVVYHFGSNPKGLKLDEQVFVGGSAANASAPGGGARDAAFAPEWQVGTCATAGTWSVEMRIPYAAVAAVGPPRSGEAWRANFRRRFGEFKLPEAVWSPVQTSYDECQRYGYLKFQ